MVKSADSVTETLCQQIQDQILRGELAPGSRLSEREMAKRFGVSRTPMREVFITLLSQRLVERHDDAGIYVRETTPQDVIEAYQIRLGLDSVAAGLAAKYGTDEQIAKIGQYVDMHKQILGKYSPDMSHDEAVKLLVQQSYELEAPLHVAISQAAGNSQLNHMIELACIRERCWIAMVDFFSKLPTEDIGHILKATAELHEKMFKAIKTHNAKEAVRAAFLHSRSPLDLFLKFTNQAPTLPADTFDNLISELDDKDRSLSASKQDEIVKFMRKNVEK